MGKALFDRQWVAAPSSTRADDGLGPLYNARSCAACHQRPGTAIRDGAPAPPGLVARPAGGSDPVYGRQIQTLALPGLTPEAQLTPGFTETVVTLNGGQRVSLRQPHPRLDGLGYGPLAAGPVALRIAPQLAGLGAIAALPDAAILAAEDPDDRDHDGISGRARRLADGRLGRFGWKADMASVHDQVVEAFRTDIGLGGPGGDPAGDCTPAQTACRAAPDGADADGAEIGADVLRLVTRHVSALPAPSPLPADPRGESLFGAIGCALCHRPAFDTAQGPLHPYSDFLLHDMGPGLADPAPLAGVAAGEWRTAPLWGITRVDSHPATFLHDGRARSLIEAILWHGGEAERMRDEFTQLDPADRQALLRYLASL